MEIIFILIVMGLLLILLFLLAALGVRIVSPYEKGVVERLGRYQRTAQPGLHIIIPFVDTMRKVDMREQVVDVQPQEVITKDNVVVTVDAIVYYEATDPVKLTYNVADFYNAATKLAQTNLRNVVGETELDEALTSREMINAKLRSVLDDATDKWGVKVVRVEIQRIDPPPEVVSAMHAQMRAERDRRATVTEAQGYREAAILDAEGDARAIELRAQADRLRIALQGQGEGEAAEKRLAGIKAAGADQNVLTVEYLQALARIGDGRATKLVIPADFSGLLGSVAAIAEAIRPDDADDEVRPKLGLPIPDPDERVELPPD